MRTAKNERNKNAKRFYQTLMKGNCKQAAIVIHRPESTNPNIHRCQFWAVVTPLAFMEKPVVIAESVLGIPGCFKEFLNNVKPCIQKDYYDDEFNRWLKKTYGFEITYKDGLVFMLERV